MNRVTAIAFSFLLIAALPASARKAEVATKGGPPNLVELAVSAPDLSTLVAAVQKSGLVGTLADGGPFTVFAPTNEAFASLLAKLGYASLDDVPVDALTAILLDHVVEGRYRSSQLANFDRADRNLIPLGGLPLDFDRHPVQVNDIDVVQANLRASNGIVHVIDQVLLEPDPRPSIAALAAGAPQLSTLLAAVTRTKLDLVLDAGGPFTVFAPTNDAFAALLAQLGLSSLDEVDDGTLVNILLDHVVARELDGVDLVERSHRGPVRALGNERLFFRSHPLEVNGIGIASDAIEARNGTVYVIDGVLLQEH